MYHSTAGEVELGDGGLRLVVDEKLVVVTVLVDTNHVDELILACVGAVFQI